MIRAEGSLTEPGDRIGEPGDVSTVLACRSESHRQGLNVFNFRVNESHTYFCPRRRLDGGAGVGA